MAKYKQGLAAIFLTEEQILEATRKTRERGFTKFEAISPYPIHGMEEAAGIKRSWIPYVTFVMGVFGLSAGLLLTWWTSAVNWPLNVGGKPFLHIPTYIPITFELAILCTAFGMVACFFIVNKMAWGKNADIIDIRVTDDLFVVAVDVIPNRTDLAELSSLLKNNGAIEIREKEFED
jgi:hypothetical protein